MGELSWAKAEPVAKSRTLKAPFPAGRAWPRHLLRTLAALSPPATLTGKGAVLHKQLLLKKTQHGKSSTFLPFFSFETGSKEDTAHRAVSGRLLSVKIKENSLVTCPLPHGRSSVRKDPRSEGGNGLGWVGWSLLHPVPDRTDARGRGTIGMGCCCCCSLSTGEISKVSLDTNELGTAYIPDP